MTGGVRELWPLLEVTDLEASVTFWCERLGFTVIGQAESEGHRFWCRLVRGGACVMLQEGAGNAPSGPAPGVTLYFVCDDADAMYGDLVSRGLELDPPVDAYYGMRQIFVTDPNGYALCFESPTEHWKG